MTDSTWFEDPQRAKQAGSEPTDAEWVALTRRVIKAAAAGDLRAFQEIANAIDGDDD